MTLVEIIFLCCQEKQANTIASFKQKDRSLQLKEYRLIEGNWADLFLLSHRLSCFQYTCNNKTDLPFGRVHNNFF